MLEKEKEVTGIYITGHPLDDYQMELDNYINCPLEHINNAGAGSVKIAGILTTVNHGVSQKNGLGYARVTMQDYTGAFDMGFYNEEYKRYKDLLSDGQVIYVEGDFKKGYNDASRLFFKVKDVRLLASLSADLTKSLTLRIPLTSVNDKFIDTLSVLFKEHKGKHSLKMKVFDLEDKINIDFNASGAKVDIDSHLIKKLTELGLSYKLN